ncbi:MAG: hypothetical protein K2I40_00060 [Bifidobacterium castoris]|nr:hypothetical protein [Bifidobacterium castoris]
MINMQYFTTSIEDMVNTVAGDYAQDFDIDAIVDEYIAAFDVKLEELGCMCSMHSDGSITDWDWADEPGWAERHITDDADLDAIRDSIDLGAIMAAHDDTAA